MADQEVVEKVCQIYADDGEKCAKVLENLSIEDAKCVGRENSAMWKMLKNLIAFDQQFKYYCERVVLSPDKMPPQPTTPANVEAQFTTPSRPGTPMEQILNERSMSPYHPELPHEPAPSAKCFTKWTFYLMEQTKSTAICVHPRFFVTFRHGSHRRFNIGNNLKLYHAEKEVDEQTGVDVCVAKIFEAYDFILLKSRSNVVDRKPSIANAEDSIRFTLAGFGNDVGSLSYLPGLIHSVRRHYFSGLGPFILGTSRSSCGDSGGGIWGAKGLIGMNYGAKNIISPALEFEKAYMEELEKERKEEGSPPNKKSCLVTVVDGSTLYGAFV